MRRVLLLIPLLTAVAGAADDALAAARALEKERIELASRLAPAVCAVFRGPGGGSGVVITRDGLVLSNFHVTELENEMRIGLLDARIHEAVVLGVDPSGDLSLLRLKEPRDWAFAPLGDSDALRQGDWVYAMGNPFLLATDFSPTITLGVISGIHRYQGGSIRGTLLYPDCIQTDASINPGNSGGPLFNFQGQVVGINGRVSLRERGRVNIGVGYAISSNQIKRCLPDLRAGQIVEHGTLNATVRSIDDPEWPGGVRVTFDKLLSPGCAYDAGIQIGDALVEFMGERITGVNQFSRLIAVLPKGRRISLRTARFEDGRWGEREHRLTLDGIPLVDEKGKELKKPPRTYLDMEVDRTFAAARAALQPVAAETREGTLTVEGRDPVALGEAYAAGRVTWTTGDRVREATAGGGRDGDEAIDPDLAKDMLERVAAWNDLLSADGRQHFATVDFTGGALVGHDTVDRIEAKTKEGVQRVYFVHLDTGLLRRLDIYSRNWARWISLVCEDWREANGLLRPYKVTVWDRDKEKLLQTIVYTGIRNG
ncbi:MAG TPA: trypsin-like peptidase domain-containing protein [Planctomycetota bacterium]|nr:trypsin-like peptidase domain-containing protein [Planctomycetota bacterium]